MIGALEMCSFHVCSLRAAILECGLPVSAEERSSCRSGVASELADQPDDEPFDPFMNAVYAIAANFVDAMLELELDPTRYTGCPLCVVGKVWVDCDRRWIKGAVCDQLGVAKMLGVGPTRH